MQKVELIGFYKRDSDGTEYVYYSINGEKRLTNGICKWCQKAEEFVSNEKYKLRRVDKINTTHMLELLRKNITHLEVIALLN